MGYVLSVDVQVGEEVVYRAGGAVSWDFDCGIEEFPVHESAENCVAVIPHGVFGGVEVSVYDDVAAGGIACVVYIVE